MNKSSDIVQLTPNSHHHFYGYYDGQPWGKGPMYSDYLLCHRVDLVNRLPAINEYATLLIVRDDGSFENKPIGKSYAWNFQLGSMVQWLPQHIDFVIYNDRENEIFCTKIGDINGRTHQIVEKSFSVVDVKARFAYGVNYSRLAHVRPDYGYFGVVDPTVDQSCPSDDGIWRLDLAAGKYELLLDLESLVKKLELTKKTYYWINHIAISPRSQYLSFLLRDKNEYSNITTRLVIFDLYHQSLEVLYKGMVSHYIWYDNNEVLAWCGKRELFKTNMNTTNGKRRLFKLRQIIERGARTAYRTLGKPSKLKSRIINDRLRIISTDGGSGRELGGILQEDSHFTITRDKKRILGDTYPDRRNIQKLFVIDIEQKRYIDKWSFAYPLQLADDVRCDLHPRWSRDEKNVCVDSVRNGTRQMYKITI